MGTPKDESGPSSISIPPPPISRIRLTRAYEADEGDVADEAAMFHPSCEAVGCASCGAYQDRSCALLYGVPSRRAG